MADESSPARFKADMPQIPGVSTAPTRPGRTNPLLPLIVGVVVFGVALLLAVRWFSRPHPTAEASHPAPTAPPQIEVPAPPPDPASLLPHVNKANPEVTNLAALSKPWSSVDFYIHDLTTDESVLATIVRLPTGSPNAVSGYWAFSRKAPSGSCPLDYITDLGKLHGEYEFQAANHPLVGNPCSHTLYDPLKTANLPGDIWIRGAIVQGSDVRPPLGVEIKIQGKQILAIRTE
jgi:hypothetical protein